MNSGVHVIEAALFISGRSMDESELAALLPQGSDLRSVLAALDESLTERGICLVRTTIGWALRSSPDSSDLATHLIGDVRKLTKAAAETLAVCVCFGPVTRSEIERVRGVQMSPGVIDQLLVGAFIRPGPRRDTPGRPLTWTVTDTFLEHFDLMSIDDLASLNRMRDAGLHVLPVRQNVILTAADGLTDSFDAEELEA